MKLFYFSGSTLPSTYANAVHVMKMCQAFTRACGAEVTLFAKAGENDKADVFLSYGVQPIFDIYKTYRIKNKILSGPSRIVMTLYHAFFKKHKPDLVYGRDVWTMAALAGTVWPIAFELHEIPQSFLQGIALRRILRAKNLLGLVVITKGLKYDLIRFENNFPAQKILVAPDGADVPAAELASFSLVPIEKTVMQIGYAGSLYAGKGVELILDIAALMPEAGFHIFGGPEALRTQWMAQNPPANIHFYGHVPHGEVQARLAACDVLVAPYLPHITIGTGAEIGRWISPLKLFEYMAARRPILCSDLPVLREVMEDGRNGLLVDPENPLAWAEALRNLHADSALAKRLAEAAYGDLVSRYSWEKRAEKILDFLKKQQV